MANTTYIKNILNCCRTCLNTSIKMNDIFEERNDSLCAAEILSLCTSIKVSTEDKLPKQLCSDCYNCVVSFYEFKKIAETINKTLQNHILQSRAGITENKVLELTPDYNSDDFYEVEIKTEDVNPIVKLEKDNNTCDNDSKENQLTHDAVTKVKRKRKLDTQCQSRTFVCNICSETFKHNYKYVKHLVEHDQNGKTSNQNGTNPSVKCDICGYGFKSINSLSAHKRKHTKKGRVLSCWLCDKVFQKVSHLKRHELCHENNRPYKCNVCKKSFTAENVLNDHLNKHNGIKPYCCPICSKRFAHQSTLTNHIKIHTKEKRYLCPTCGKRFDCSTNLNQHARRHTGIKLYACNLCPKSFVSKGELKTHTAMHTGERSYVCAICNAAFVQSSSLRNHSRTHLGIKPFHCDVCPMKFRSNYHLQRHYRIHSGERPYRCEICERAFTQSNDLEKHRRAHLGDDLYKCDQCSKSFRLKTELRQHISEHYISSQIQALSVANNVNNNISVNLVIGQGNKDIVDGNSQNNGIVNIGNEH